jgi:dihydroorotate dehydrogenase electron transfer subunit
MTYSVATPSPRRLHRAILEANEELSPGYRLLRYRLDAPLAFRAGQFAMLRGDWAADPLLARPMSILRTNDEGDRAEFLLKVVGHGTALLCDSRPGARATVLAPLGRPFPRDLDAARAALLVGGGVGVPPVFALARELAAAGRAAQTVLFLGGRSAPDTFPALAREVRALGIEVVVATEDGSAGVAARVTVPLAPRLADAAAAPGGATLYACGPDGMLRALAGLARDCGGRAGPVRYLAAVEQLMACGFGACLGCVLECADGNRRLVCSEGPVLDGRLVYG